MNNNLNKQISILVLEDEKSLQFAIISKLDSLGFSTLTSRTVDEAIAYLNKDINIDAVWLDHHLLGEKNGLDFIFAMKNYNKYRDIPVFVVANTGGPDTKKTYLELGAKKYFIKSNHRLDDIIQALENSIKHNKKDK